jgi:prolyl oligopeptidase
MSQNQTGRRVLTSLCGLLMASSAVAATLDYPASPKKPVTDHYYDVSVVDPYQWLEDVDSPDVKKWIAEQNALTQKTLGALPNRTAVKAELKSMMTSTSVRRDSFNLAGGRLFAMKNQPPKNQRFLVVMNAQADLKSEHVVVDPNKLDSTGNTSIDWYQPSLDGKTVGVSLSKGGSEDGALYLFDVATGRQLKDVVPRVQYPTGGGSMAWAKDSHGFYYTRYPQGSERPAEDANFYQQVYFHKLGTPASSDQYVIGKDFPRIAETELHTSEDGQYVLASVANGDGGEHAIYLKDPSDHWLTLASNPDGWRDPRFGRDNRVYAVGIKGSPHGRIVALDLKDASGGFAAATVVVPDGQGVIQGYLPMQHRLYVDYLQGGPSEIQMFGLDGSAIGPLGAMPIASVDIGARLAGDAILFGSESYTRAFSWFRYDPSVDAAKPVALKLSDPPSFAVNGGLPGAEAVREFAISKDGTNVPVTIVSRTGTKLDGKNPTILTAYGGYELSVTPHFSRFTAIWLAHGGVFAEANLRGGGEFGDDWHKAGYLTKKQNVFDDFAAAALLLMKRNYTASDRLAIIGGSNGGLLMGAALVQHPEMYRAVVSEVGIYDMLRVENTPNGAFNVTEFGSVKDPAQFKALLDYSPYHHVVDGTVYPALLLTTGQHDGRVAPWMSYKMAARMQAASPDGRPVLLRVAFDQGHGFGTSLASELDEETDVDSFLFSQLQMH